MPKNIKKYPVFTVFLTQQKLPIIINKKEITFTKLRLKLSYILNFEISFNL
jgi:hypothetical protein